MNLDAADLFMTLHPGFFEKENIRALPPERVFDEQLLDLHSYAAREVPCPEHITFGFYEGDWNALLAAVAEVKEHWVRFFEPGARVYCGFDRQQVVSFCLVKDYGSYQGLRIGAPGWVGTRPRYRGQGIGLKMVQNVTAYLKDAGFDLSYIHYTGVAHWYAKLGYQTVLKWNAEGFLPLAEKDARELLALRQIEREMASIPGHTGFYYKNLITGKEYGVRAEETFSAASVIKLPLMMHILAQCHAGHMRMEDKLLVTEADKVPICGALTLFTGPVEADVRTLCRLMISLSDNTATNRLIRHATLQGAADGFAAMGLAKTKLTRLLFDAQASQAGLRNVICPKEMGMLLESLWRHTFVSAGVSQEALEMLLLQQVDHKLNGKICGAVSIAHKTGEDDGLSNDVGIVYAQNPFVICFAGHDTDVYAWEDLMRRGAYELWRAQED